jgi:maleylacetoacetate isomerase
MLTLYGYWRSSASYRVRIALNLKGLAYQTRPVHLVKGGGEQHQAEYLALNPQGRVPLLVDGDFKLSQSLAIMSYLEQQYPSPALLPTDVQQRARIWQFCETLNADIQPLQNLGVLNYLTGTLQVGEEPKIAWIRHWIDRGLSALEQDTAYLPERACVFGDSPSLADCCLVPQVFAARRFGATLSKFPRLLAIAERLDTLPAFAKAHPDQQPDAQA